MEETHMFHQNSSISHRIMERVVRLFHFFQPARTSNNNNRLARLRSCHSRTRAFWYGQSRIFQNTERESRWVHLSSACADVFVE